MTDTEQAENREPGRFERGRRTWRELHEVLARSLNRESSASIAAAMGVSAARVRQLQRALGIVRTSGTQIEAAERGVPATW